MHAWEVRLGQANRTLARSSAATVVVIFSDGTGRLYRDRPVPKARFEVMRMIVFEIATQGSTKLSKGVSIAYPSPLEKTIHNED